MDASDQGEANGWASRNHDDTGWEKTSGPWSPVGLFTAGYEYRGTFWYRKRLHVPERFHGKFLLFAGVSGSHRLYIDGQEVSSNGVPADPVRHGFNPGWHPFRARLPADRDEVTVALRVTHPATPLTHAPFSGFRGSVTFSDEVLVSAGGFWLAPDEHVTREEWLAALHEYRRQRRKELGADDRIYTGEYAWASRNFLMGPIFVFDTAFYDAASRTYRVDAFLDRFERRFGGYDAVKLWWSYPNSGVDQQDQLEMLRNLPGGLAGVARAIERFHARGVKVFIPYLPWDTKQLGGHSTPEDAFADVVARLKVDGVSMDVTSNVPQVALREALDRRRPGVVLSVESGDSDEGIVTVNNSGNAHSPIAGWLDHRRGLPKAKWTEPRHILQALGDKWRHDRTTLLQDAFLNGTGVYVAENNFGSWNRYTDRDAAMLRRMVPIQRHFADLLTSPRWEPFVPSLMADVDAHLWPGDSRSLWTLANWSSQARTGPVLRIAHRPGTRYFDVWNGEEIHPALEGAQAVLSLRQIEPRGLGAIVAVHGDVNPPLAALLERARRQAAIPLSRYSDAWIPPAPPVAVIPEPTSTPARTSAPPAEMVLIPVRGEFRMMIEHNLGEGGCYPDDNGADWARRAHFMYPVEHLRNVMHSQRVFGMRPFFMDRTLVTQGQYQRFVEATGYRPRDRANFLKDWDWSDPDRPKPRPDRQDHPVVWVDLEDARAYLRWAGKRLPTEQEWQYAAGGPERRRYPWGDTWEAGRANDNSGDTTPVTAFASGRTPEGLHDMSGNVWQLTESERDDGNRYVMLRGGSHYQAPGSAWYFDRYAHEDFGLSRGEVSARPTNYHAKFYLLAPSADRKATIGFRGVREAILDAPSSN